MRFTSRARLLALLLTVSGAGVSGAVQAAKPAFATTPVRGTMQTAKPTCGTVPAGRRGGVGRRAACAGAGLCVVWLLADPRAVVAAAPPVAASSERVHAVLGALERLISTWEEATEDCRFGEVKRELLSADSKAELLVEASTFATFNKEKTMNVLCKRSPSVVRALVDSPSAQRVEGDLRKLVTLVPDESSDDYLELIESWSSARSSASAAAYISQTGDLASVNAYKKGTEDGASENLQLARRNVTEAARVLRAALLMVS
ncbi:hypothetical protein T492DRAFT_976429 [Pavlovales sp. CCMP2436]|nr:hypothetical protein T492DRAFT_976429 [Pavlovales sp. CCMP2436]|mmetsp:Transcript_21235/g.53834  ORF Transcript_21235/g.53834 Transcript_21235/m.53834 type:complete len:260 (+) Transcript_21235:1-780(+)